MAGRAGVPGCGMALCVLWCVLLQFLPGAGDVSRSLLQPFLWKHRLCLGFTHP